MSKKLTQLMYHNIQQPTTKERMKGKNSQQVVSKTLLTDLSKSAAEIVTKQPISVSRT